MTKVRILLLPVRIPVRKPRIKNLGSKPQDPIRRVNNLGSKTQDKKPRVNNLGSITQGGNINYAGGKQRVGEQRVVKENQDLIPGVNNLGSITRIKYPGPIT